MRSLLLLSLVLCSCASPTRSPAQERSIDALPLCSRIKYSYVAPQVPLSELPNTFNRQAISESKQVWTAAQVMARDTRGACVPTNLRDLITKPEWCHSDEWSGPYLEPHAFAPLARMTAEEFEAFQNCWR